MPSRQQPTRQIIRTLGRLSRRWLDPAFSHRKRALEKLIQKSCFTKTMAQAMLDSLFSELTPDKLELLLKSELKNPRVLDAFQPDPVTGCHHRAFGPKHITHIFAGNVPNPAISSVIFGLLVQSQNSAKCSSKDDGFLDIYLDSLLACDKRLGENVRLIRPGNFQALGVAIKQSDLVVAYGSDETLTQIKKQIPAGTPFIGYGHRISFSLITREPLSASRCEKIFRAAALDIWMADSRGCLSPAAFFIEKNPTLSLTDFAVGLTRHLKKMDFGAERLYALENQIKLSLLGGSFLTQIKNLEIFYEILSAHRRQLQCVAVESSPERRAQIAERLAELGVNRLCRFGDMQSPPIGWHHDGQMNLATWLRWADLEP